MAATDTIWAVGPLQVTLPADWKLAVQLSQWLPLPGPPGYDTQEEYRQWQSGKQARLSAYWWTPRPPQPGGPLAAAEEWPATVAGQAVRVIRTSQFMGAFQEVLVTHLRLAAPEATGLVYASGLSQGDFMAILGGLTIDGLEH